MSLLSSSPPAAMMRGQAQDQKTPRYESRLRLTTVVTPLAQDDTMGWTPILPHPQARVRIILIGNAGVGKSSIVQHILKLDPSEVDVVDGRAGQANIERAFSSSLNPRLVLHDSKGFESGIASDCDRVQSYIKECQTHSEVERRINAIWLCLVTPRDGSRLIERGDEELMKTAFELKIPVIVVFTKYDLLVNQFILREPKSETLDVRLAKATVNARLSLDASVKRIQEVWKTLTSSSSELDCVKLSISKHMEGQTKHMLAELTKLTRDRLREAVADG